ncbi:hypothetical protein R1flu_021411 [Riccia fluitans]|uniref:Uncharacterized protein n=1 Tax=Riccia fluitans TaxID=41844 RepID=A0ABD1ZPI4_9MARC
MDHKAGSANWTDRLPARKYWTASERELTRLPSEQPHSGNIKIMAGSGRREALCEDANSSLRGIRQERTDSKRTEWAASDTLLPTRVRSPTSPTDQVERWMQLFAWEFDAIHFALAVKPRPSLVSTCGIPSSEIPSEATSSGAF